MERCVQAWACLALVTRRQEEGESSDNYIEAMRKLGRQIGADAGLFLVCSSTQKCSSKEICAVLLSKMCSWQMDNISKNRVNF